MSIRPCRPRAPGRTLDRRRGLSVARRRTFCTSSPRPRSATSEDGSVSAELVVATPLTLLLLMVAVQAAVWWHATHIAESVAAHALAAARVADGTVATGQATGERVLDQLAGTLLTNTSVTVGRGPDVVQVQVSGTAMPVIPGLALPVRATAAGATEPAP